MGKFDGQIRWLKKEIADATNALADLQNGAKVVINDEDRSRELASTYERIIAQCKTLIGAYEKRND